MAAAYNDLTHSTHSDRDMSDETGHHERPVPPPEPDFEFSGHALTIATGPSLPA
jgi:hypothetical protein